MLFLDRVWPCRHTAHHGSADRTEKDRLWRCRTLSNSLQLPLYGNKDEQRLFKSLKLSDGSTSSEMPSCDLRVLILTCIGQLEGPPLRLATA